MAVKLVNIECYGKEVCKIGTCKEACKIDSLPIIKFQVILELSLILRRAKQTMFATVLMFLTLGGLSP